MGQSAPGDLADAGDTPGESRWGVPAAGDEGLLGSEGGSAGSARRAATARLLLPSLPSFAAALPAWGPAGLCRQQTLSLPAAPDGSVMFPQSMAAAQVRAGAQYKVRLRLVRRNLLDVPLTCGSASLDMPVAMGHRMRS